MYAIHSQNFTTSQKNISGTLNTLVHVTVDVLQNYTIVNCFFSSEYNHLSCHVDYGKDCDNFQFRKERAVSNGSDVSVLLSDIAPSTLYCFIVTANSQSHTVKVQGSFTGILACLLQSKLIATVC